MLFLSPNIKRSIPLVAFTALAFCILLEYQDMLFTAHLRTPFIHGVEFWNELKSEPFAIMRWIGCWFTQTAYYPMLATIIYLVIWGISYFFLGKTLNLKNNLSILVILPFACMLLGLTSVGYWIYIQKDWGFWFSHPLAFLVALIILWATKTYFKDKTIPLIVILYIAIYPVIGYYSIMMAVSLMILQYKEFGWKVCPLIIPVLSPTLWHIWCYDGVSTVTMWLGGFPIFVDAREYAIRPMAPFIASAIFMIVLCIISAVQKEDSSKSNSAKKNDNLKYIFITSVVLIISYFGIKTFAFSDYNYQAEMRMSKYAMEDNWNAVIKEAQATKEPSHSMVLLKNVALLNTGQLGDRSFRLGNYVNEINNPDSIQLNSMQICSPVVYYNYGKLNYSIRWCIEFAVGYGFSPYYLMNLIRAAKGTGEDALVKKYMDILHCHMFYKDWQPLAKTDMVKELQKAYSNTLDADNDDMETYLIRMFSRSYMSPSKTVIELSLFNSMLYRNPDNFWYAFANYCSANKGKPLPLHYQEAYLGFMNIWPVELSFKPDINPMVQQSFDNFLRQYGAKKDAGLNDKALSEEMSQKWRGSYFWYMLFGLAPK